MLARCPVLDWAASGGMALTGQPDGWPVASPAPAFALLTAAVAELAAVTGETGGPVRVDPGELVAGRAALAGFVRRGRVSAGGSTRLLRAADGWCAVSLSRAEDVTAVPAIVGALGLDGADGAPGGSAEAAWEVLAGAAVRRPAAAVAGAAQLLGVPAGALPGVLAGDLPGARAGAEWPPGRASRIAAPSAAARLAGAVVVDLSSMWAGPLCSRLLGLAGADVIKVETPYRPDGARAGDRRFFEWLHAGQRSMALDFRAGAGRDALAALLAAADVVIEASRPRALAQLGLAPELVPHRDGQVWLSITGHGRGGPAADLVAFGDDAAVAGGLVGWADDGPVFCADAIADPLTGLCGALAVARSVAAGGGELIDLALRDVAACFAAAPAVDHGPHEVLRLRNGDRAGDGDGGSDADADFVVTCARLGREQAVRAPAFCGADGGADGADGVAAEMGADTAAVLAWLGGGAR